MVNLLYNTEGKVIGWEMRPVTEEEHDICGTIRDMQFFGMGETYPEYNGLKLDEGKSKSDGAQAIDSISWVQKKYQQ